MFKKNFRLRKRNDFLRVQKLGRSVPGRFFFIKFAKNKSTGSRIGVVVSLKVSKKATERNLIRRRIREIAKENLLSVHPGYDIVVFASQKSKKAGFDELKQSFRELLMKSGIIK